MLVATDLSENAEPVYLQARAMARALGARVTLLCVDEVADFRLPAASPGIAAQWRQTLEEVNRRQKARLDQTLAAFREDRIETELTRATGKPAEKICELAHATDADLVVLGKRGVRMISGINIGRTTKRVLRRCRVPTLVVPESAPQVPTFERLIATTNFTQSCAAGLRETLELAGQLEAAVEYVHVIRLPMPFSFAVEDWGQLVPSESRQQIQHTLAKDLSNLVGQAAASRCSPVSAIGVSVSETLRDLALESGAALIAIPARGKRRTGLFGSTAENVLKLSPVPVLIYPVAFLERADAAQPR